MKLTFNIEELKKLIEFEETHMETGEPTHIRFVGDEGVYFMPKRVRRAGETARSPIVYAEECNPKTMEFDDWWYVKRNTWGGDDGGANVPFRAIKDMVEDPEAVALVAEFNEDKSIDFITKKKGDK